VGSSPVAPAFDTALLFAATREFVGRLEAAQEGFPWLALREVAHHVEVAQPLELPHELTPSHGVGIQVARGAANRREDRLAQLFVEPEVRDPLDELLLAQGTRLLGGALLCGDERRALAVYSPKSERT
jgi:hypothetical protein